MYTSENLQPTLLLVAMLSNSVVSSLPANTNPEVRGALEVLAKTLVDKWFSEFLAVILNTYENGKPDNKELAKAIHHFADILQEIN